jgi:hypothetical protein
MVMPPAGAITYLDDGPGDATAAAAALRDQRFNDPSRAQPLPAVQNPYDAIPGAQGVATGATSTTGTASTSVSTPATPTGP